MSSDFQVVGTNDAAPFTLKVHRGEGMALLAMNWKGRKRPPDDFVGFGIQFRFRGERKWLDVENRIGFVRADGTLQAGSLPTRQAPIQMFRWVHFPRGMTFAGAEVNYRVTPVFMDAEDKLTLGEPQEAKVDLGGETYKDLLNVTFTRGFVASQAFADQFTPDGPISTLLPEEAADGLDFQPTHPKHDRAYAWMGFEARDAIVKVLDAAIDDPQAQVRVIAYDLNMPELVTRLERLGHRLKIIIDNSDDHGKRGSAENAAAARLAVSAGRSRVKRQHMGNLQHNKTIVVDGPAVRAVVWGSTNFSWRGFYVQSNNALIVRGADAVGLGMAAFEAYWANGKPPGFRKTDATKLTTLGLPGIDAQVTFSPHGNDTARLAGVGVDIAAAASSVLYSMAFLAQTGGPVREALKQVTNDDKIFVYGIADRKAGGISLRPATGNPAPVFSTALDGTDLPEPFKSEQTGGSGIRMHHKFVVIDFDKPEARVWMGSYNFSSPADKSNGENLLIIKDRRIATSYMVEALRIFDHYSFRVAHRDAKKKRDKLTLRRPPRAAGEKPWFDKYYTVPMKARDRKLFS